eukprot:scaffold123816_cov82-Phaeocystis_antarctica.AAC.2
MVNGRMEGATCGTAPSRRSHQAPFLGARQCARSAPTAARPRPPRSPTLAACPSRRRCRERAARCCRSPTPSTGSLPRPARGQCQGRRRRWCGRWRRAAVHLRRQGGGGTARLVAV